jgi:hypothetical protein
MGLVAWFKELKARHQAWADTYRPHLVLTLAGNQIELVRYPGGNRTSFDMASLRKVLVATNDSGPWGDDVWFVLEGSNGNIEFPLGTEGGEDVIAALKALPGFEMRGMNSTANAEFECWPNPSR